MKIQPIITEKSLAEAKKGNYSFYVDKNLTKFQIRRIVSDIFGVNVVKVRTARTPRVIHKNYQGRVKIIKAKKKAIVTLKENEKIDLFEEKK